MKSLIIVLLVVAVIAPLAYDVMAADKPPIPADANSSRAINKQAATDCNLCYSCGGDWPIFAGSFRAYGNYSNERGSYCSGAIAYRYDLWPYLCCKD